MWIISSLRACPLSTLGSLDGESGQPELLLKAMLPRKLLPGGNCRRAHTLPTSCQAAINSSHRLSHPATEFQLRATKRRSSISQTFGLPTLSYSPPDFSHTYSNGHLRAKPRHVTWWGTVEAQMGHNLGHSERGGSEEMPRTRLGLTAGGRCCAPVRHSAGPSAGCPFFVGL